MNINLLSIEVSNKEVILYRYIIIGISSICMICCFMWLQKHNAETGDVRENIIVNDSLAETGTETYVAEHFISQLDIESIPLSMVGEPDEQLPIWKITSL